MLDEEITELLSAFPAWLETLGSDATSVSALIGDPTISGDVRLWLVAAVGYLFKSLDLIPDGLEDIGYVDDAFVLRVAVGLAAQEDSYPEDGHPVLDNFAEQAGQILAFLGDDTARLVEYVSGLRIARVRGHSPSDVIEDEALARQLADEVAVWASAYAPPAFARDEKTLLKLRAFLRHKLP